MIKYFCSALALAAGIYILAGCSPSGEPEIPLIAFGGRVYEFTSDLDTNRGWEIIKNTDETEEGSGYIVSIDIRRDSCEAWVAIALTDSIFYMMMQDLPTANDEFGFQTRSPYFPEITWGYPGSFIAYSDKISESDSTLPDCVIMIYGNRCDRSLATAIVESIRYSIRRE